MKPLRSLALAALALSLVAGLSARDASQVQPLLIGSQIPKINVRDDRGVEQYLPALLTGKRTVLVFYRGGWCPYCSVQLQALAASESKLREMGFQIIAISPDSPANLASVEKKGELAYELFSDADLKAAKAFGISFALDKETVAKYKEYGIDLAQASGGANARAELPVPAVFLVTPDNEISFAHVDPDYRFRLSERLLLAAAADNLEFHKTTAD